MPDEPAATEPPPAHPMPLNLRQKPHHLHHLVPRRTSRTPRPRSRGVRRGYKFTCTFCWETYRVAEGPSALPAAAAATQAAMLASCGASSPSASPSLRRGPPAAARALSAALTSCPRIVGTSARIACEACWIKLHNLSICWACGDSVVRGEECVSFGWTFWHRACFGCLSCRAPLTAPGDLGEFAVEVFETPVCEKCRMEDEVASGNGVAGNDGCEDSGATRAVEGVGAMEVASGLKGGRKGILKKQRRGTGKKGLDPHVYPNSRIPVSSPPPFPTTTAPNLSSISAAPRSPTPYLSIFDPLNTPAFKPTSRSKKPPNWLARLPSGPEATPRPLSKLSREISVGSPVPSSGNDGSGSAGITVVKKRRRRSGPVVSFAQDPRSEIPTSPGKQSDARKKIRGRKATPIPASATRRDASHKTPHVDNKNSRPKDPAASTPYPFFQNPRRPIIPAVESTWSNNKLSPGLFPYAEEHSAAAATSHATKKGTATSPTERGVISSFRSTEYLDRYRDNAKAPSAVLVCPCCNEPIGAGAATVATGNGHVYHEDCFRCRGCKGVVHVKGEDWVVLGVAPWHRRCVRPPRQQHQQQARRRRMSSVAGAGPRMGKGGTAGGLGLGLGMGGFFSAVRGTGGGSARKLIPPPPPSPPPSLLTTFDDSCAGCGKAFPLASSPVEDQPVPGPRDTAFHKKCMKCRRCEGRLKAGNRWYEWDGRGLMGILCRECWRRGRLERGVPAEEVERMEREGW